MSVEPYLMVRFQRADDRLHAEMAAEQITHPMHEYQPGSERLEKLYQAMALAQRFILGDMEPNL